MASETMTIKIHVQWWVRWFIGAVVLAAVITDRQPDEDKVARVIQRGLSVRLVRVRWWLEA